MGAETTARRKPWTEKNVIVAGVLAYLIPGAGHLYQGRTFKGVLYFVCILGTFFGGLRLGEGAVVYNVPRNQLGVSLQYLAQVCVGLPALPGFQQAKRANAPANRPLQELDEPLSAEFTGELVSTGPGSNDQTGTLQGRIELQTVHDGNYPETRGRFVGTLDGKPTELQLGGGFFLDRPIGAGFGRRLSISVARGSDLHPHASLLVRGSIPRKFWDAYAAPPDVATLQELNGRLGKFYDLAIALTMIAGLLNVLAIWDAIDGPAYGFGDETPAAETPAPAAAAEQPSPSAPAKPSIRSRGERC
jgi:hypothetical protein